MTPRTWLPLIALVAFAAHAPAQSPRDRVTVQARFGFPPGPHAANPDEANINFRQPLYKPGAWTPVYIDVLNTGKYDEKEDGSASVVVETLDCDDAANSYRVRLPSFDKDNPSVKVLAYTRPGSRYSDFTVRVVLDRNGRDLCQPHRASNASGVDPAQVLYLALGSKLPGLKLPGPPGNASTGQGSASEMGRLDRVEDLPPHWFGYNAADLVILSTGDRSFMTSLANDNSGRKAALAEWVRRGGKLLVLVGKNPDMFNDPGMAELNTMLPVDLTAGFYELTEMRPIWKEFSATLDPVRITQQNQKITVAKLTPRENRAIRVLADGPKEGGGSPLIVQGAHGLGKVTVVAVDLDQLPFTRWSSQGVFWEQILRQAGPRVPNSMQTQQFGIRMPRGAGMGTEEGDATLKGLVQGLENFEGVPVISFGWVALFILLYILVVGPIDYLFLKKVVKRLELTWITFPTVVIAVSAAAYFTAYALKGNDLRINKFDLVDVDLHTKHSYGRTWFSLFSPRIQNYTIGVEPAEGWAAPPDSGAADTLVSWFGAPKQGQRSLFRRSYEYEPLAVAMHGVPIQVWSTKNFEARWRGAFAKDRAPFAAALRHPPGKADEVIGTITSQLPVELIDAVLIYKGEVASLGRLAPDAPRTVSAQARIRFSSWRNGEAIPAADAGGAQVSTAQTATSLQMNLLFHEEMLGGSADPNNGALREVDASWRASDKNLDEAILVARVEQAAGQSEELTRGPGTPCRLWLGELPSSGKPRPTIPGTMRQETYVRVFIPVAAK